MSGGPSIGHMGQDHSIRVPFSIVALGLVVLAGGIVGHILADQIGMWAGMVIATVAGLGILAWRESQKNAP